MWLAAFDEAERRRLLEHGTGVLLIGGIAGLLGYAYALWHEELTGQKVNAREVGEEVGMVIGCIVLILALLHLTVT